jgi:hypothetical protein
MGHMEAQVKAIETAWKGYRFRSRLEARWAVAFETLGIEWLYESQGFEVRPYGDGPVLRYLPDFYLPQSKTWVEVKGDPMGLAREYDRQIDMHDFGGILPEFRDSYGSTKGLLLLGNIPDPSAEMVAHPMIVHHEGLHRQWVMFSAPGPAWGSPITVIEDGPLESLFGISRSGAHEADAWVVEHREVRGSGRYYPYLRQAYTAARSARFEHGEAPA